MGNKIHAKELNSYFVHTTLKCFVYFILNEYKIQNLLCIGHSRVEI